MRKSQVEGITMPKHDIIVIGASAGGVNALIELMKTLPSDLKASVFIVMHLSPHTKSFLPNILSRQGRLNAVHPKDGDRIEKGKVYIAPPDHHLLLENDRILIRKGPKENRFRPSIDSLFRSAAYSYGPRCIGVVLSGLLDDGTSGMWTIKHFGGKTIIQDPSDALYASMPQSVLEHVAVDHSVPVSGLAELLVTLTNKPAAKKPNVSAKELKRTATEVQIASQKNAFEMGVTNLGEPSLLTCPECNGTLVSIKEGKKTRYRCHTGHAFGPGALLADITKSVEEDLWKVVRGMEESIILLEEMSKSLKEKKEIAAAKEAAKKAAEIRKRSQRIHEFIFQQGKTSEDFLKNGNGIHENGTGAKTKSR